MTGSTDNNKMIKVLSICGLMLLFSCSQRNLTYLSDLQGQDVNTEDITNSVEATVQPYDLLDIDITSLSPESNALFSNGILLTGSSTASAGIADRVKEGYLVDKDGYVVFPVMGKVKLAGLTKEDATRKLSDMFGKYAREPIVDMRLMNFKVTVIGEVNNPSTFVIPAEKISILEAIGLAGDMTAYGKRENVLLIREHDGKRSTTRLNLNNKEVLNSPFFYLQQNDVIYVEADKAKAVQVSLSRRNVQYGLGIASVLALLFTRIF